MAENDTTVMPASSSPLAGADLSASQSAPAGISQAPGGRESATDLRLLVGHTFSLAADASLELAQQFFSTHTMEFVAALDGGRPVGLCARRQVGILLGARFGFSLFARNPVRQHLLPEVLIISVTDSFHVRRISDHLAGVFICDVMGHGVRSAMITAAMRALVEQLQADARQPGELLERLNHALCAILRQNDETIYASAAYLVIDTENLELCWASAGHPCPLVLRERDESINPLALPKDRRGKVLGLVESATYQIGAASLEPGDRLLLYTDGIYEIFAGNQEFGMDGFIAALRRHAGLSAPALLDRLLETARAFGDSQEFEDDVCLLAIDVGPQELDFGIHSR